MPSLLSGLCIAPARTECDQEDEFLIGIGKAAQAKLQFRVGDIMSGHSAPVADPRLEPVAYYKTTGLKLSSVKIPTTDIGGNVVNETMQTIRLQKNC